MCRIAKAVLGNRTPRTSLTNPGSATPTIRTSENSGWNKWFALAPIDAQNALPVTWARAKPQIRTLLRPISVLRTAQISETAKAT